MLTPPKQTANQQPVLEFKSSTVTVPVLHLAGENLATIEVQLRQKISQAPDFFKNSPLIIDFKNIRDTKPEFNMAGLLGIILKAKLQPIGIRGGNKSINQQAQQLNIAMLAEERKRLPRQQKTEKIIAPDCQQKPQPVQVQAPEPHAEIVTHQVRSGQQLYAPGDLIILAAVSAGAEIIAVGNIHVYGALRGRALAGVNGNQACRIFCSNFQAELISIAGNFQVNENIAPENLGKAVQVSLENQKLIINEL